MSDNTIRARLADVLEQHELMFGGCSCGWRWVRAVDSRKHNHLADVLLSEFDIRERITVTREEEFELPWA